jgi:hypothetical protein
VPFLKESYDRFEADALKSDHTGNLQFLCNVWRDFSSVLTKAIGLVEFNASRLEKMIDVAGQVAGSNPAYTAGDPAIAPGLDLRGVRRGPWCVRDG